MHARLVPTRSVDSLAGATHARVMVSTSVTIWNTARCATAAATADTEENFKNRSREKKAPQSTTAFASARDRARALESRQPDGSREMRQHVEATRIRHGPARCCNTNARCVGDAQADEGPGIRDCPHETP